ncbi:MAG: hypothetical protein HYZ38_02690 [Mycobacterium sp.]|nr:hypothetical protein [Mycobacterium sp.]
MPHRSEADALAEIENRLIAEFPGLHPDEIRNALAQANSGFSDSRIRDFVPLLVERRARTLLSAQDVAAGK